MDLSCWQYWGSWPQYPQSEPSRSAREDSSLCPLRASPNRHSQPVLEDEPLSPALMVPPEQMLLCSWFLPRCWMTFCRFQDLLRKVAEDLHVPLEEVQGKQRQVLDILHALVLTSVALPINDVILQPAQTVWHTPATCASTPRGQRRGTIYQRRSLSFCSLTLHLIPS